MLDILRRRPLASHYVLAWAIALAAIGISLVLMVVYPPASQALPRLIKDSEKSAGYINIVFVAGEALRDPTLWIIFLYASAPSVAALIVAGAGGGGGLRRLLSRLKPVGPEGTTGRSAALYLGVITAYLLGFWIFTLYGGPGVLNRLRWLGGSLAAGLAVGLFIDEGGSLEELGWRGFEWPLLQAAFRRPLVAALILGLLHWAWHLPREIPTILGGGPLATWAVGQATFLLLCLALSIVAVFCVNRTGGSVWPAIFVHGGSNAWAKAAGEMVKPIYGFDLRSLLLIAASILIVVFAGKRLGRARELTPAA